MLHWASQQCTVWWDNQVLQDAQTLYSDAQPFHNCQQPLRSSAMVTNVFSRPGISLQLHCYENSINHVISVSVSPTHAGFSAVRWFIILVTSSGEHRQGILLRLHSFKSKVANMAHGLRIGPLHSLSVVSVSKSSRVRQQWHSHVI